MQFNENVKAMRKMASIPQKVFADKLNISQNAVSKYERGDVPIPEGKKQKIALIFGVSIETIENFHNHPIFIESNCLGEISINTKQETIADPLSVLNTHLTILQSEINKLKEEKQELQHRVRELEQVNLELLKNALQIHQIIIPPIIDQSNSRV